MRFVVATFLFAMGISYGAVADTLPPDIKILLDKESALNDRCRGGSGDDPQTQKYCDQRNETFGQLKSKGWCYGPDSAPMYQKAWSPCLTARSSSNGEMQAAGGVGAKIEIDGGQAIIRFVAPGMPADLAGLQEWDIIRSINGQSLDGLALGQVQSLLRGPVGTNIEIDVQKSGSPGAVGAPRKVVMARVDLSANSQPRSKPHAHPVQQANVPESPDASDASEAQLQYKTLWAANTLRSAMVVQICGLRSDIWQRVMQEGVSRSWDAAKHEFRETAKSVQEYDQYAAILGAWLQKNMRPAFPSRNDCAELVSSPEMALLDKIEWNLSGGYH